MTRSAAWRTLGQVTPESLLETRLQAHWAAQNIAALADAWLTPAADDSHTSLEWLDPHDALVGQQIAGRFRAALHVRDFEISLLDTRSAGDSRRFSLANRTLDEALQWLAGQAASAAGRSSPRTPTRRDYEMPPHPAGRGEPLRPADPAAARELANWFANAQALISDFVANQTGASPVRTWPHHFDTATLISLDPADSAEKARSIGVGLSPGDDHYPEPYFYVTPWPYPSATDFPELTTGGLWHREGWVGAVLPARAIVSAAAGAARHELVRRFLENAVQAARVLLARGG